MDRRLLTAVVGLAVSLLVSAGAWLLFDTLVLFFLLPFVPILFGRARDRTVARCPVCEFRTTKRTFEYCPRDGHRLRRGESDETP